MAGVSAAGSRIASRPITATTLRISNRPVTATNHSSRGVLSRRGPLCHILDHQPGDRRADGGRKAQNDRAADQGFKILAIGAAEGPEHIEADQQCNAIVGHAIDKEQTSGPIAVGPLLRPDRPIAKTSIWSNRSEAATRARLCQGVILKPMRDTSSVGATVKARKSDPASIRNSWPP